MSDPSKNALKSCGNTATFLFTNKPSEHSCDGYPVKIAIVGCGNAGVAIAIAILFKVKVKQTSILFSLNIYPQKKEAKENVRKVVVINCQQLLHINLREA